ncbi:MAG: N-formylglutamate amidohydrolase [Pyrinomonadaceae bacterium]
MKNAPFYIKEPAGEKVPFVLSLPHRGTEFPPELKDFYVPELVEVLDDTDWDLEKLYDFASDLGVTTIYAKYSRWVIDLNRDPASLPLYDDGRLITELCPKTTFLGENIYLKKEFEPDDRETERRLRDYYYPYHARIDELIHKLKDEFGRVIFWDGHSIRRKVKTIRPEPFPDLILGDNDGRTAGEEFVKTVLDSLGAGRWEINHNDPFRGGFLTRSKGDPEKGVHALQLEMSKDLYMSRDELVYDPEKAGKIKANLKQTFEKLIGLL